ncbi:MmcQ/YjbR family DNA-binding protein [Aquimarina sp. AD10]|uniref:MmcQ-like protein n=1 Tax=Aquimarina aggregata TaxID=1642818 RepID=A0A163A033_9FLAO|nr:MULTISPECIES: MmcQ/YjbR family DNA-binding protein [Aquimarina]AXT62456.1 MmcQ/YjbR family DNA-binding protein [Aquimarina sp. AD10]KZS40169.1 MmcQ-like protein [Aquimarina aggregata]RKM90349.1 MmcQ/YjbR family DNA-binding protein [Aquimarina sp. AD10]
MNIEAFREYCLSKKGVTEHFPFDETTLVFKVMGKMFALTGLERIPFSVNLKCDPDRAIELREYHSEITPGYHMSKKHWNTVNFSEGLATNMLIELIDHSYDLVVSGLTKKVKQELENL